MSIKSIFLYSNEWWSPVLTCILKTTQVFRNWHLKRIIGISWSNVIWNLQEEMKFAGRNMWAVPTLWDMEDYIARQIQDKKLNGSLNRISTLSVQLNALFPLKTICKIMDGKIWFTHFIPQMLVLQTTICFDRCRMLWLECALIQNRT